MDDAVIVDKLSNRDQSGLKELKSKYGRLIASVCQGILRSPQDIEEVENDVFLAIWNGIPRDDPENLTAYICKIARRKAVDKLRYNTAAVRNSDLLTELDECLPSGYSPEDAAEKAELIAALNEWLQSQSEKHQRLFVLRYFNMLSVKEAARSCKMSVTAVTTALSRLRGSLKNYLIERGLFYD
ncbi:MAG: sigma-70 family RNA polymerase sigma factor [Oscillospiraceae bacterium]|nr:sigma-70 family RNA polymerase sigma factor [Oscillospiraceae bacterium]